MRWIAAVAAIVSLGIVAAAGEAAAGGPVLRLVRADPVVLTGAGFAPGKPVAVTYGMRKAVVVTSPTGRFRIAFALRFVRCAGATASATASPAGPVGDAVLRVPPCASAAPRLLYGFESGGMVRGQNFVPYERVHLSGRVASSDFSSTGSADSAGRFAQRVTLPSERCAEVFVKATGALGSRASVSRAAPDCKSP
jgi:hypothetical protein